MPADSVYVDQLRHLAAELDARPGLRVQIWWSEVERFACTQCASSCRRPWNIAVSQDYYQQWLAPLSELTGLNADQLFVKAAKSSPQTFALLAKKPGSTECVMLDEQGLCRIHGRWGASAKPGVCQMYPFVAQPSEIHGFDSMALSLSCTRAARMLMEPQDLYFRLIETGGPPRYGFISLDAEHQLSRSAWLHWLGYALDGLTQSADFASWLRAVALDLNRLQQLPPGILETDKIQPLDTHPVQRPEPQRGIQILPWVQKSVMGAHPAFAAIQPWLASVQANPAQLEIPTTEWELLQRYFKAYWLRQLLVPANLLRDEHNLVQEMFFVGIQGILIHLWALYLRDLNGQFGLDQLTGAANQVYAFVTQDHMARDNNTFRKLGNDYCLTHLMHIGHFLSA